MAELKLKPLDAGFKRNLLIFAGMFGIGVAVILGFVYMGSSKKAPPPQSRIGTVVPMGNGQAPKLSPATQAALNRVETKEANEARENGRSYIASSPLGEATKVSLTPQQSISQPPRPHPQLSAVQRAQTRGDEISDQAAQREHQAIIQGLLNQMQGVMSGLAPATVQVVAIKKDTTPLSTPSSTGSGAAAGAQAQSKGALIIGGDQIVPAELTTPIDTDTSKFALAEITGGPLKGAVLRGSVVPMSQSGDIEDVGVKFTSMRLNDKMYTIDAIALNEKTASDAMDGSVDHHIISRVIMPIIMAGVSGASVYFTAKGTPATSVASNGDGSTNAVIVNQAAASAEQARDQGIGQAVQKAADTGTQLTSKMAARPNEVTLPAFTPIGIIFNAPVYESQQK